MLECWNFHLVTVVEFSRFPSLDFVVSTGGLGVPTIRQSHRDAGCHLKRNQEALLRSHIQSGPELQRRGLGRREGRLKAEGNDESLILLQ